MQWLNCQHLLYFWAAARRGSVAAANELRLSGPTLSAQIRRLEESLGDKLLRRSGRRLVLTDTGRLFGPDFTRSADYGGLARRSGPASAAPGRCRRRRPRMGAPSRERGKAAALERGQPGYGIKAHAGFLPSLFSSLTT